MGNHLDTHSNTYVVSLLLLTTLLMPHRSPSSTSKSTNQTFGPPNSRRHVNPTARLTTVRQLIHPRLHPRPCSNSPYAFYLSCLAVSIFLRLMPHFMIPICAYTNRLISPIMSSIITIDALQIVYWPAFVHFLPPYPLLVYTFPPAYSCALTWTLHIAFFLSSRFVP